LNQLKKASTIFSVENITYELSNLSEKQILVEKTQIEKVEELLNSAKISYEFDA
jgi:hypothetical protein